MGAFLLNVLPIEMQYICTAILILICVLVGAHLYVMYIRKPNKPREKSGAASPESENVYAKLSDPPSEATNSLLEQEQLPAAPDCPVSEDFEKREQVSASEVQGLISDEIAAAFIEENEETEERVLSKPKGIINIDTLSENFQANETVTLESLKEKKLIGNSVNYVKVLARGVLNKPLVVKMPEFSVDAVKMILLTGGKVIKLKAKRK